MKISNFIKTYFLLPDFRFVDLLFQYNFYLNFSKNQLVYII